MASQFVRKITDTTINEPINETTTSGDIIITKDNKVLINLNGTLKDLTAGKDAEMPAVGGRNLLLDTGRSFTGIGTNDTNGNFNAQGGQYYLAGGKKVSDLYNQYGSSGYITLSFDWVASGSTISGKLNPVWNNTPWGGLANTDGVQPSSTNKTGHYEITVSLKANGYSTGTANGIIFRQDNLQGNITISNVKLEAGNVATDWTPAPEDVQSDIVTANKAIKKNSDDIKTANKAIKKNSDDIKTANTNIKKNADDITQLKADIAALKPAE